MSKKEARELRYRKMMTGMSRKYSGGVGKIPSEFLPSGEMKVIRSWKKTKVEPREVTEEEKRLRMELNAIEIKLDRLKNREAIFGDLTRLQRRLIRIYEERIKVLKGQLNPEKG